MVACERSDANVSAGTLASPDFSRGGRIHVAAIQIAPIANVGLEANLANVESLIRTAASRGARYILLPEYFPGQLVNEPNMTGHEVLAAAQDLDGSIARRMLALCKELDINVAFPLAERRTDGKFYNSVVFASPRGVDGVYAKNVLLFARNPDHPTMRPLDERKPVVWQERELFSRDGSTGVFSWGGVRVGSLICADGGFANLYQARIAGGAQLIAHSSASPGLKAGNNPMPDEAARLYNRPVIFANNYDGRYLGQGNTQIADANGKVLAHLGKVLNGIIDAEIDLAPVSETKAASAKKPAS
jgi:predicted amidohydrolase